MATLTEIKELISESAKINFAGSKYLLKVDVNEDPNKKGVKIQFIPLSHSNSDGSKQNDAAIEIGSKLDAGLKRFGLAVERDRNLKNKTIIGFFIYVEYIDRLIRKILQSS
jgi:hypothetical protein